MEIYSVDVTEAGKPATRRFTNPRIAAAVAALFGTEVTTEYVSNLERITLPEHRVGQITEGVVTSIRHKEMLIKLSDATGFWELPTIDLSKGTKVEVVVRQVVPFFDKGHLGWHYVVDLVN